MDLARILAAVWMVCKAHGSMEQNLGEYLVPRISGVADYMVPVETRWATCMQAGAGEDEDTRILRELENVYFYGCIISIAECGRRVLDTNPERDILDAYARMFHGDDYRAGKINRNIMISEIVAKTRFAEIRMMALASAVYLENRREKCVKKYTELFEVERDNRYEILVLASSSVGIEWLSSVILNGLHSKRKACLYVAAKKYLANRTMGKGRIPRLRRYLRDESQNDSVYLDMRRLILEAIGVSELSRVVSVQKGVGMGVITASSISRYLNRNMIWVVDLMCRVCPREMGVACKDHAWSTHELELAVEGYYPQILQRIPLETLVAYLERRRNEQCYCVDTLPAIWVAMGRIAATAREWYRIVNIASRGDLAQIEAIESEKNDALCALFSRNDSMEALERGGLRRWMLMTRGPEAVRLVLWRMAEAGMLAGKTLDMDEAEGILKHRREDILQLVRDGGARLRVLPAGLWDLDKELLEAMERSSTLEILEIEHNVATIKMMSDRRMWPLIEILKTQAGPECAVEIDTLILSMAGNVAREYRDHLHTRSPAKRMRTGDAPVWAAQEPAEGVGLRE